MHEAAAKTIIFYFANHNEVEAVLLTGSCARIGRATKDSCLDISIILRPSIIKKKKHNLYFHWENFYNKEDVFSDLRKAGQYSHIDLDIIDCDFTPGPHGYTSGPDSFELEIGNTVAYSKCLFEKDNYYSTIKKDWLPYYDKKLRDKRLNMVIEYCLNNLDHIPLFVERGLNFQAFSRLYNAIGEFLQALFIHRRTYPIAYDKWINEQLVEILELPELYEKLVSLFKVDINSKSLLIEKADGLRNLLDEYIR